MLKVDMDLSVFPKELKLKYGKEGNREWYEWVNRKRAVVIQRTRPYPYWHIYFMRGEEVRIVEEELTEEDRKRGIVARAFSGKLEDCIQALRSLGFSVELEERINYEARRVKAKN